MQGKESACSAGDHSRRGLEPWVRKIPWRRGGHGNPLRDSCLENPMDRGAWWDTVQKVAESDTAEHARAHTHTEGRMKRKKEKGIHC